MTDKQNPRAVAAPASAPPRSNEKGISEFVSIASRPPAPRAATRSPLDELVGKEKYGDTHEHPQPRLHDLIWTCASGRRSKETAAIIAPAPNPVQ
jgi:hypothetical protein